MFWLKNCPRCAGDLYEEEDLYGPYIACVQCGFQQDFGSEEPVSAGPRELVTSASNSS